MPWIFIHIRLSSLHFKVIIVLTRNNRRFTDKTYTLPHNLLKEKNHEDGYEEKKPEVDGGKI